MQSHPCLHGRHEVGATGLLMNGRVGYPGDNFLSAWDVAEIHPCARTFHACPCSLLLPRRRSIRPCHDAHEKTQ